MWRNITEWRIEYMATIGLDKLFYAPITEDENGDEEYLSLIHI